MAHYLLLARSHPDNSHMRGFFDTMKNEMFYDRSWNDVDLDELKQKIDDYLE